MAEFKGFAPGVQVNGETVLAIVDGMGAFKSRAVTILAENAIRDPKPGAWYSQQCWLDAFKDISALLGAPTLFAIGKSIPENANFPPVVNTIPGALEVIDRAYHMNHRGGDIGCYAFNQSDDVSGIVLCHNPYPCDFDRGVITGTIEKFKPARVAVRVRHDDAQPCRRKGAGSCMYLVNWYAVKR